MKQFKKTLVNYSYLTQFRICFINNSIDTVKDNYHYSVKGNPEHVL